MQTLKKIFAWIVLSSEDPTKYSLMIKGIGMTAITVILSIAGVFNANISAGDLSGILDGIVSLVQTLLVLVSIAATIYGGVRKVVITLKGDHPLLQ